jgi:hypothetical protein
MNIAYRRAPTDRVSDLTPYKNDETMKHFDISRCVTYNFVLDVQSIAVSKLTR